MAGKKSKVFVALSGGVDSSTAAALLIRQGFDCQGVFMATSEQAGHAQADAEKMADCLGIKLHVLDMREEFKKVLSYFGDEYARGRTPNPCVFCNRYIKFGRLWQFAKDNGADFFATGHYAKIVNHGGGCGLYETKNKTKDQSYVLSMIDKNVLPHIILPLADLLKEQTKELAKEFGLHIEGRKESQEICFIPNDDYIAAIEQYCPALARTGNIIDSSGKVLGSHNGIHRFTIGQRRGLNVAMGVPYYVTKIDAVNNTVTLGPKEEVMHRKFRALGLNWLVDEPMAAFGAKVKIRYNSPGQTAAVQTDGDAAIVEFDKPVSAITPGQLAAFYIEDNFGWRAVASAWIDSVIG